MKKPGENNRYAPRLTDQSREKQFGFLKPELPAKAAPERTPRTQAQIGPTMPAFFREGMACPLCQAPMGRAYAEYEDCLEVWAHSTCLNAQIGPLLVFMPKSTPDGTESVKPLVIAPPPPPTTTQNSEIPNPKP